MPKAVIFFCLNDLPAFLRVISKPARIVVAHRDIGGPMHHPAGQFAGQPRPPADADLRPAAAPVIAHARRGADQRVAIWGMRNRAMHFAGDAKFGKDRHPVQAFLQPWHDPVVIGVEQPVFIVPRAMIVPDTVRVFLLVNPDQPALLLHPDIAADLAVVADHRQFALQPFEFRHRFGDEIMVRHRGHRQLQP